MTIPAIVNMVIAILAMLFFNTFHFGNMKKENRMRQERAHISQWIADNLKRIREEQQLLQKDVAAALGISPTALSRYEKGERVPSFAMLDDLADYYSVTFDDLLSPPPGHTAAKKKVRKYTSPTPELGLPVLGRIRAGIPILADENIEGHLDVPPSLRADFALRVTGDSMSGAGILEGDIVICRETQTPQSGQIVVALKDDGGTAEATLKYFFNGQQPVLKAANPKYSDIDFTEGYRVAGVMVACVREDAPGYQVYRDSLAVADKEEWTEVIEKAAAAGIKPEHLKAHIDMLIAMTKGK